MKNKKSNNSGCLAAIFPFLKLIKPKNKGGFNEKLCKNFIDCSNNFISNRV